MENDGEDWEVLKFPAEKDGNFIEWDHRGWDENHWKQVKGVLTTYEWNSLYMQEPFLATEGDFTS